MPKLKTLLLTDLACNSTSSIGFHEKIEGSHMKFLFLLQNPQTELKNLISSGVIDSLKIGHRFSIFEQKMLASPTMGTLKLAATFFEKLSWCNTTVLNFLSFDNPYSELSFSEFQRQK